MSKTDEQVSIWWRYFCKWLAAIVSILLALLIAGGGWFCTTVWAKEQEHDKLIGIVQILSDRLEANTKALDRLTTRFDDSQKQQSQNNLTVGKRDR